MGGPKALAAVVAYARSNNPALQDAATSLVNAETEYQIAQIDLAFATGTTLGAAKVAWTPVITP